MKSLLKIIISLIFLLSINVFSQNSKINVGGYFGSALSANLSFSYNFYNNFFVRPNINFSSSSDYNGKSIYSFTTYELDLGYNFKIKSNDSYCSIGLAYNYFSFQDRQGHDYYIDDLPPYEFSRIVRDASFGFVGKIGITTLTSNWFSLGFEAKYLLLFPKVNYWSGDLGFSRKEKTSNILFGVVLGFSF